MDLQSQEWLMASTWNLTMLAATRLRKKVKVWKKEKKRKGNSSFACLQQKYTNCSKSRNDSWVSLKHEYLKIFRWVWQQGLINSKSLRRMAARFLVPSVVLAITSLEGTNQKSSTRVNVGMRRIGIPCDWKEINIPSNHHMKDKHVPINMSLCHQESFYIHREKKSEPEFVIVRANVDGNFDFQH